MSQKSIIEEIKVTGTELVDTVKDIVKQGNVRRIIIRNKKGKTLLEIPLTIGAAGLGATLYALGPFLSAIGFFALYINDFSVVVERARKTSEIEADAQIIEIVEDEGPDTKKE